MDIRVKKFGGEYPSFNICFYRSEDDDDDDAFFVIKNCRIVEGRDGDFIGFPSRPYGEGKYFSYGYADEGFQEHVLNLYDEAPEPEETERKRGSRRGSSTSPASSRRSGSKAKSASKKPASKSSNNRSRSNSRTSDPDGDIPF